MASVLNDGFSRWGRVQGADDSARHAYICRGAGMRVAHCDEQSENDGPPASTIVKGAKPGNGYEPSAGGVQGGRSQLLDGSVELDGGLRLSEHIDRK